MKCFFDASASSGQSRRNSSPRFFRFSFRGSPSTYEDVKAQYQEQMSAEAPADGYQK